MSKKRKKPSRRPTAGWRGRGRGGGGEAQPAPDAGPWADDRGGAPGSTGRGSGPQRGPAPGGGTRSADPSSRATQVLTLVAAGRRGLSRDQARSVLEEIALRTVVDAARPLIEDLVTAAWANGWQPTELVWHTRRVATAAAEELMVAGVRADAARVRAADVHPLWAAQLAELGATPPEQSGHLDPGWLRAAADDSADPVGALCDLLAATGMLPPLQVLLPVPGRPDIALDAVGSDLDTTPEGIDPKVLAKVRALLAKAEATTFEAEAQAFTAKAHDLMTRHSLEHAVVSRSAGGARVRPLARRLLIDDPYADAKGLLVQILAQASRCRAVSHQGLQMSTVVGFESDVAATEVLFTSLLVQAQTALQELARSSRAGSRERSRGFRASFLRGFAHRIGERLEAAGRDTVADLDRESGGALVPVLVEREAEVEDHLSQLFPRMVTRQGAAPTDALGYRAGTAAAERADLPWAQVARG